jgi:hypothetical protein
VTLITQLMRLKTKQPRCFLFGKGDAIAHCRAALFKLCERLDHYFAD